MYGETRSIGLIGFMATGKTTVGKTLAVMLHRDFHDTDSIIEKDVGKTVSEIFVQQGESYFRVLEADVVRNVCNRRASVISFGGGAPLAPSSATLIKESSIVVLLQASIDTIMSRIAENDLRPLVAGRDVSLRKRVIELLDSRKDVYEDLANLVVDTDRKSPSQTALEIIERLHP